MRTRRDKRGVDLETWMRRRRRRRMFLAAVAVGMIAGVVWQWSRTPTISALTGRRLDVLEVIGPTTLRLAAGEGPPEVSLLGVVVPEAGETAAIAWLREQVGGGHVMVEFDAAPVRDQAGRMAAYVYRDEMMLNEAMLRAGLARADDRAVHRLSEWFARLEQGATRQATP
jgi:hypothetical protein